MTQLPLLPQETALDKLDPRVRTTFINDEQYVSVLDILQYHGKKKNPAQAWQTTLEFMERQGAPLNPFYGLYQFPNKDGKKRKPTPVINLNGFLRIVQSAEVPEWELLSPDSNCKPLYFTSRPEYYAENMHMDLHDWKIGHRDEFAGMIETVKMLAKWKQANEERVRN